MLGADTYSRALWSSGGGGADAPIRVRPRFFSPERLLVRVRDNGVGLPEGQVGRGLGTQIVRTLIQGELGGTIDWHTRSIDFCATSCERSTAHTRIDCWYMPTRGMKSTPTVQMMREPLPNFRSF